MTIIFFVFGINKYRLGIWYIIFGINVHSLVAIACEFKNSLSCSKRQLLVNTYTNLALLLKMKFLCYRPVG